MLHAFEQFLVLQNNLKVRVPGNNLVPHLSLIHLAPP